MMMLFQQTIKKKWKKKEEAEKTEAPLQLQARTIIM